MASLSPNLNELSNAISRAVEEINHFLAQNDRSLSFDSKQVSPFSVETTKFRMARMALYDAASTLMQLALSPGESAMFQSSQVHIAIALRIAHKYKLARYVPLNSCATYSEIASQSSLGDLTVERVFGLLMMAHYFYSPSPGHVAHTNLSRLMAADEKFDALVGLEFEDLHGWASHIPDALAKWGPSDESTETGLSIATSTSSAIVTPITFWEYLEKNKPIYDRFTEGSAYLSATDVFWAREVDEGFDWSAAGNATVIDVGGSRGQGSIALARKFPNLQFVVQDYAHVCQEGEKALPGEFRNRIKFQAHDMFQPQSKIDCQPVIFFLRTILHDWSDKYACKILQEIIPGMKPEDRIVLVEMIMPEPGEGGEFHHRLVRMYDMEMWACFNSLERTALQFKVLVQKANPNLEVISIHTPGWGGLSTIEIALRQH